MKAVIVIFAVLCGAAVLAYLISEIKIRAEKSSSDFTTFETREDIDENEPAVKGGETTVNEYIRKNAIRCNIIWKDKKLRRLRDKLRKDSEE